MATPKQQPSYVSNPPAIPGKPISKSFPTPNLVDRIVVVRKDTRAAGYEQPDQKSVFTGVGAEKMEGWVYATSIPTDQLGWVDEYWINDRKNQEAYNYVIEYPYASKDFPRYTRTYVVFRDDPRAQEPDADTNDPIYSDLKLVDHKVYRIEDKPELDAICVVIQRIYEKLPGPLITSFKESPEQQVVTSTFQEVQTDVAPTLDALTIGATIERKTTAKAAITIDTVDSVFASQELRTEVPDLVPAKFRAFIPIKTEAETLAGTATQPALGTGELSHAEQQTTEFRYRKTSTGRDPASLPITLLNYKITPQGQIETISETLDAGVQSLTANALTLEGDVTNLGNATSLKTTGTVDSVFPEQIYGKDRNDFRALPVEFRVALPEIIIASTTAGTAAPPVLAPGDLTATSTQTTEFRVRNELKTRDLSVLPITLVGYRMTPEGQVITVLKTLDQTIQTITPDTFYVEASVENLGAGISLKTTGTVDSIFPRGIYETRIPDIIPERFRVAVPTDTIEETSTGTANTGPTLGTGELQRSETQVSEFHKRVRVESRAAVTLPVSLSSYRMSREGQVETIVETLDNGLQTITPALLTTEASVQNLGNNQSLQTIATVPGLFTEPHFETSIPDVIPERFRVAVPTSTTSVITGGTASAPTLGTGDLRAAQDQINEFKYRKSITTRAGITLPVSLSSSKLTNKGQIETITETLDTGVQTFSADALTEEATVQNLGNNTSLLTFGTVPDLFTRAEYNTRIPDVVPERFRVAVPTTRTGIDTAGTAAAPTLGTGDLEKSEQQLNEFVKRTTTETRAGITLPVSLTSYRVSRDRQVETLIETLDSGLQTVTTSATTTEASVQNLGNNTSLKTEVTVPNVFPESRFGTRIPDVVPERFRVAVPTSTTSGVTAGTAAPPTLGTGDLSAEEQQLTEFTKRTSLETRAGITLPVSLVSSKLSRDKQVETVTETLDTGVQTFTPDALTEEANVQNLGNGTSLLTVGAVPDLFTRPEYRTRIPDVVPERFRVAVPTTLTAVDTAGTAVAPTLGTGDLEKSETQVNEFVKRTSTETRAGITLPVSLTSYKYTSRGQVETVVETLDTGLQTITGSSTTEEAKVDNLGNGTSLKEVGTVPSLFTRAEFETRIPDVVPERFRVAVPTTRTAVDTAGTASAPTLGTGDLDKSETQLTAFVKRTSTETRAGITLPVSLLSSRMSRDRQVETLTETLDTGVQTFTPDSVTTEAKVDNLGNGTSLLTVATVPDVFSEARFATRIPDVVPERFRVAVPTSTTSAVTAGTAVAPTLGTGDLSAEQQQITEFTKRTTLETRAGITLPVSLVSSKLSRDKQVETVTETLDTGVQTFTPTALTEEANVQNLGNGTSLLTVGAVPSLFTRPEYRTRIPDVVPERFRVAVPTTTTAVDTAGTAAAPTLGTGDLEASETQVNEFVKRTSIETRAGITLPVSLTSYKYTPKGQVETIIETLDTGLQTITGSATTEEAKVDNLGNGTSLKEVGTVPSLFTRAEYETRIPDVVPERFRVAVPTTRTAVDTAGTAAAPTLGTGDLSKSDTQLTAFVKRTSTETRAGITLPVSLVSSRMSRDRQVETLTETLDTGVQTFTPDSVTTEAKVDNLGNGTSLLTVATVPNVFAESRFGTRIPDVVPERFRVAVPTSTTSTVTAGTAVAPTLGTGDLSAEQQQITEFTKRVNLETRAGITLPVSLVSSKLTRDKQIETVTETLDAGVQTFTPDALTQEADVQNLGNGTSLLTLGAVGALFTRPEYRTRIPDVAPERFRVAVPTTTTAVDTAGTAAAPTLGTGDLEKSETQVNEFVKRTSTETRAGISLPVSLVSYKYTARGQVETVTETLNSGLQTITGSATTEEAKVDNLGNGTSLLSVGTVPSLFTNVEYDTRIPDVVPERFRVAVPTTRTTLDTAGTAAAPTLGTGDLEKSEHQLTAFVKRTSTETRAGITLPVSLVSSRMSRDRQVETITETLDTGVQTFTPDSVTTEAKVDNLGNGTSLLTVATVPDVFADGRYSTKIPDVVPERFRVAVPTSTSSTVTAGTAVAPTLGTGDLSAEQQQITEFTKRTTLETRAGITLPVSLVSSRMTRDKQVETVTETLDTGVQTFTPTALTEEAKVDNLGNGTSLLTVGAVSSLFTKPEYRTRIPDVVPERFRVAVPTTTTSSDTVGTASAPVLGTGDLDKSELQVNEFVKRTSVETRAGITLPVSLTSYKYTARGQVETVVETLDTGVQTITGSATTEEAKVDNLGDGTSLKQVGTVPTLFTRAEYDTRIPDVVPERFRVAVPTTRTTLDTAGTAVAPTLGTGDLEKSEQQLTAFVKRTSTETRAGITLPVSLTSYKMTRSGQVETMIETLDTGLQTITPDGLTEEAKVDNLGNGTSLQSVGTVPALFTQPEYQIRIPDVVPERFRVAVPTTTTSSDTLGTAAAPTLGTGDLYKTEQQKTEFVKRLVTETRSGITLPVSLTSYAMSREGQVETVIETLDAGLQTITPTATTKEAKVDNLGNGTSLKLVNTVPSVFSEASFATRIPDVVPEKFRVAVPTSTTSSVTTGTASAPVLGTGDLSAEERQLTEFTYRNTLETRAGITLPVSLTSYKYTSKGQVETVVETLDTGLQTITGSATTEEAKVDNLGNGTSLKEVGTVPALFTRAEYRTRIPDVVPERFRVAVPTTTTAIDTAGTAAAPTLGTGDLEITDTQLTAFVKRTSTETRSGITLPVSLTSYRMSSVGQIETLVETLDTGLQTITPTTTTTEAKVDNLGNGTSLLTQATTSDVFSKAIYGIRIPDVVPERFRVAVPTTTSDLTTTGTAAAPTLGTGDLSKEEEQVTEFHVRTKLETRAGVSLPVSLSYKLTREKQVSTVVETYDNGLQTLTPSATTVEGDVTNLGNGTSLKTQGDVPSVFPANSYGISVVDLIPAKFRAAVPMHTSDVRAAGTASTNPVLGTGEIEHEETQEDAFIKRTRTKNLGSVTVPVTLQNQKLTKEYYGGVTNEILTLNTTGSGLTVDEGPRVIDSYVLNLGNGYSTKLTEQLVDLTWPVLVGTDIDDKYDIVFPYTHQIVAPGTTGGISGSVRTEVKPIDKWHSLSIARTIPSNLTSLGRTYTTVVNHRLPDETTNFNLLWVFAGNGDGTIWDYGFEYQVIPGPKGAFDGEVEEVYTYGPPTGLPTITKFFPTEYRFAVEAWSASDTRLFARIWEFQVPESLHSAQVFTGANASTGGISRVTMNTFGSGYTSAPTVSFIGGGGSGAAGTAVVNGGQVTGVQMTNAGVGYSSPPAVTFSGGGGSGASATAFVSAGTSVPATIPPSLPPSGTKILIDIQTERWRFGVWVSKLISVFMP
jgi:hypothetical protein